MLRRIDWQAGREEEEEEDAEGKPPKPPNYCKLVWQVRYALHKGARSLPPLLPQRSKAWQRQPPACCRNCGQVVSRWHAPLDDAPA